MNTQKLSRWVFFLILAIFLLAGCGAAPITIDAPQTSTSSVTLAEKPVLSNNKIKLTVLEVVGTGDKFGLNGRIPSQYRDSHYFTRFKLSIENLSDSPVDFGDSGTFWMKATVDGKALDTSGVCPILNSGDHICFLGSSATIEGKKTNELFVYYLVPNGSDKIGLELIQRKPITVAQQTPGAAPDTSASIPALEIGSTFPAGGYQVKLLQVIEWPEISMLNSQGINPIPPKQSDHSWLMVTAEVSSNAAATPLNLGELASPLALSPGDSALLGAAGEKYELTAVGSPTPPEKGFFVTWILEQNLSQMVAIFFPPIGDSIFITLDGRQKLVVAPPPLKEGQIDLGTTSVLADPQGTRWYVGLQKAGGEAGSAAQFSLLFEIPKGASGLKWQFLGSSAELPQPTAGTLPSESGAGGMKISSFTLPFSEACKAWEALLPCGKPSTPALPTATATDTPLPPTPTSAPLLASDQPVAIGDFNLSLSSVDLSDQGFNGMVPANLTADQTVLTVVTTLNSGSFPDLSRLKVWVTDESSNRTDSGATLSVESKGQVIWLFPVRRTAGSFNLHFPSGEVIDLSPLLPARTAMATPESASVTLPPQEMPFSHLYISDRFDDNSNEWPVGDVDGDYWVGKRLIKDGVLDWDGISRQSMSSTVYPEKASLQENLSDLQVSTRVKLLNPTMKGSYGLFLRSKEEISLYTFLNDAYGKFAFYLMLDGEWKNLSGWKENPYINMGEWNKMTVQAIGNHFRLLFNDKLLAEIDDDALISGQSGVIVTVDDFGEKIQVQFDDFEVGVPATASLGVNATTPSASTPPSAQATKELVAQLMVVHSPNPAKFKKTNDPDYPYRCNYKTSVTAIDFGVKIQRFHMYFWQDGQWVISDSIFTWVDFTDWYSCPNAYIAAGQTCSDPHNWNSSAYLVDTKGKWYYKGVDDNGNMVQGEAIIECQP